MYQLFLNVIILLDGIAAGKDVENAIVIRAQINKRYLMVRL